jgi:hypothetical protein
MPPDIEDGRKRMNQVSRYLEALNKKLNPVKTRIQEQPWVLWYHDFPVHDSVRRGVFCGPDPEVPENENTSLSSLSPAGDDFLLKVKRPMISHPRNPPSGLIDWRKPGAL